eukprot:CAMPEP_0203672886 /NCGR_PEP_ID=MMETSP0090-20130426/9742_1 /ASSEMBLY_ACC=CAM_ASM_001088 /TAXON_ID=426623 /ORGANISM="Chaetoceros affinis, Strain CCMP159" /LENGTH=302 /DNA_ID=CAMNT_0050538329 /DNA_START=62 /DNA_END=970 /DNA_ORIENTATION=+
MVTRNKNDRPRLNWQGYDDEYSYLYDEDDYDYPTSSHSSTASAEKADGNDGHGLKTATEISEGLYLFENDKDVSEASSSDEQVNNEILESFNDVTLGDSSEVVELSLSDDLAIESNNVLSRNDETSVMLFDREYDLEEKESDSTYEDDWDVLTAIQSLKNSDPLYSTSDDDWDAVSSVNSVMSMDTFQSNVVNKLSYKDMVTKRNSTSMASSTSNIILKDSNVPHEAQKDCFPPSSSAMLPIDENDCYDVYMYQEYEGYKYSRGGKNALKFRGVNRHQKGRTSSSFKYQSKNYRKGASRNSH